LSSHPATDSQRRTGVDRALQSTWVARLLAGLSRWHAQLRWEQLPLTALAVVVAAVPVTQVVVLLWSIWTKTLHVPFWDEYKLALLAEKWDARTLNFNDLWAFHNEHRPVWPRLVDLILVEQTRWNRQIMMSVHLLVGVATALLVFSAVAATLRQRWLWLPLLVPVSLLVLSWGQAENWFWAWQLGFLGVSFGAAICLRAFVVPSPASMSWRRFGVAMLGALVASLASAAGLLLWIGFLPAVWLAGRRRLALWIATGAAYWLVYLQGFQRAFQAQPSLSRMAAYASMWLGAPLAVYDPILAIVLGFLGPILLVAVLVVAWRVRGTLAPHAPWISLALYTLGVAAVTAEGRTSMGLIEAMTSRYQTFSVLFWVALLVISAATARDVWIRWIATDAGRHAVSGWALLRQRLRQGPRPAQAFVALALLTCMLLTTTLLQTNRVALASAWAWQARLLRSEPCILHYQQASPACLGNLDDMTSPTERVVMRQALEIMERKHLNVFDAAPTQPRRRLTVA
jgi:hypothetical protein